MPENETLFVPAQDEEYADYIVKYSEFVQGPVGYIEQAISEKRFEIINENYAVVYSEIQKEAPIRLTAESYGAIPKYYTYMSLESLNTSGISRLHNHPYLRLRGRGTAVAIIDSGIDYEHPAFRNPDGTSRIACLWDQSLPTTKVSEIVPYGADFTKEQIDAALASEEPRQIVPSYDENGHGTFLAGIAAGNLDEEQDSSGTAPEATLIVVKLKPMKQYLRELYLIPEGAEVFQENDIMFGIQYAITCAQMLGMPLSVCIGLGGSLGSHWGESPISLFLNNMNRYVGNVSVAAIGNEGNQRHHYQGRVEPQQGYAQVELKVGQREGFIMEFWGNSPNPFSMIIESPSGEQKEIVKSRTLMFQRLAFVFADTVIEASYVPIERQTGETLIFLRILNPVEGIWRIQVLSDSCQGSGFHMWLPVTPLINQETYFLASSPDVTLTTPAVAKDVISVTAYNTQNESLYLEASRGYTPNMNIKPDIAAPGVDLRGPLPDGRYGVRSGTSLAAAYTTGAAALLFEWAIVKGNDGAFSGNTVRNYMVRGARRSRLRQYPNPEWGYGILDLYHVLELLT